MNRTLLLLVLLGSMALSAAPSCNYERMVDQDYIRPYKTDMPSVPAGVVPIDEGELKYQLSPKGSLKNPIPPGPQSLHRGSLCYEYFCIQCHGTRLNGDGTVGQSFYPLPTDLMSPAVQAASDDALFRSISYGVKRQPPLAYTISIDDRWHLINWIHSLGVRKEGNQSIPSGDYPRSAQGLQ